MMHFFISLGINKDVCGGYERFLGHNDEATHIYGARIFTIRQAVNKVMENSGEINVQEGNFFRQKKMTIKRAELFAEEDEELKKINEELIKKVGEIRSAFYKYEREKEDENDWEKRKENHEDN